MPRRSSISVKALNDTQFEQAVARAQNQRAAAAQHAGGLGEEVLHLLGGNIFDETLCADRIIGRGGIRIVKDRSGFEVGVLLRHPESLRFCWQTSIISGAKSTPTEVMPFSAAEEMTYSPCTAAHINEILGIQGGQRRKHRIVALFDYVDLDLLAQGLLLPVRSRSIEVGQGFVLAACSSVRAEVPQ